MHYEQIGPSEQVTQYAIVQDTHVLFAKWI
jgi:hypothetical protein